MEEGVHGLEGVKEQYVMTQHLGQHFFLRPEGRGGPGGVGREAQGGAALWGQLPLQGKDIAHPQRRFGEKHLLPAQAQPPAQGVDPLFVPAALDLQADRGQAVALFDDLPHVLTVVLVYLVRLVLRADVRIPGHGDHRPAPDGKGREHPVCVGQQHILRQDIPQAPLPQDEVGGQALRDGNQAQGLMPVPLQSEHHIQGLIGQVGEGVAGVHHLGGEDGLHLVPEPVLHLLALLGVHLLHRQPADVAGPQPALQLLHHLVPLLVQGARRLENGLELLLRRLPGAAVDVGLLHQCHVIE